MNLSTRAPSPNGALIRKSVGRQPQQTHSTCCTRQGACLAFRHVVPTSKPKLTATAHFPCQRECAFLEVTRLYTREIFRLRYSRHACANKRAPRSILHRVHKRSFYVLRDWLTPRQSKGSVSPFQRPGPGKAVRLLLNELCFRDASTMTRHLRPYIAATLTNSPPSLEMRWLPT